MNNGGIIGDTLYWTAWLGTCAVCSAAWYALAQHRRIDAAARFLLGGALNVGRGYAFDIPAAKVIGGTIAVLAAAYLWRHRPPPRPRHNVEPA